MTNTIWSATDKLNSTLSGGNLIAIATGTGGGRAVDRNNAGKFYWEVTCNIFVNGNTGVGIATANAILSTFGQSVLNACMVYSNGNIYLNGSYTGVSLGTISAGNIVCISLNLNSKTIFFRRGALGPWNNNAAYDPAIDSGGISIASFVNLAPVFPCYAFGAASDQFTANFGDSAFAGAVPAGFISGFTAGAVIPLNAAMTQMALEQWVVPTPPPVQMTQIALEQWASVTGAGSFSARHV